MYVGQSIMKCNRKNPINFTVHLIFYSTLKMSLHHTETMLKHHLGCCTAFITHLSSS